MIKQILPVLAFAASSAFAQAPLLGIDKANLDPSVDPTKDFFEYAVGGWKKAHPMTAEYSRYSQFDALTATNQRQLRELIEGLANERHPQGSLQQKIGSLYRLAMDSTRRNALGHQPIQPLLQQIGQIKTRTDIQYQAARLSEMGVGTFFGMYCGADLKNSKMNLMQIGQGGLSMSNRDYYLENDEQTTRIRNAYRQYVKGLFLLVGHSEAEAAAMMEGVLKIETRIARTHYTPTQLREPEANYHKMTYAQLLNDYAGIDWSTLFLLNGVPAVEEVSVDQPEPIHEIEKILAEESLEDLKSYLAFKVMDDAANYLSDDFRALSFEFYNHTMSGAEQDRPRWKRALSAVEGALGMAVGKMYVEKYFPESSKQRMEQLVRNLQTALGQRIDAQKWMSDETKRLAHEKLSTFYVKIGYPDKWMDYSALDIDESLSYYENMVRASRFRNRHHIESRVNKPVDRDEWLMTPQTINAYYNPTTNEICFPAGILQPPFFNAEADDACNYGAIGVVIGHEMTHGFDDKGSQFDKEGNLRNWWTEADAKQFAARTKVMQDYFDKIEVLPGMFANGSLTLGENIADHGGLMISYQALQNAMKQQPLGTVDGYTPEQRFFLSYALLWAHHIREPQLRQLNKIDPHSNGRWRVNGALPHIDAWYEAFHVTKKSPMFVPKKNRLDVW